MATLAGASQTIEHPAQVSSCIATKRKGSIQHHDNLSRFSFALHLCNHGFGSGGCRLLSHASRIRQTHGILEYECARPSVESTAQRLTSSPIHDACFGTRAHLAGHPSACASGSKATNETRHCHWPAARRRNCPATDGRYGLAGALRPRVPQRLEAGRHPYYFVGTEGGTSIPARAMRGVGIFCSDGGIALASDRKASPNPARCTWAAASFESP